eukprot:2702869-Amphidinium_carterae.1
MLSRRNPYTRRRPSLTCKVVDRQRAFKQMQQEGPGANVSTVAHALYALINKRRGVALEIARVLPLSEHDLWVDELMEAVLREPADGLTAVGLA